MSCNVHNRIPSMSTAVRQKEGTSVSSVVPQLQSRGHAVAGANDSTCVECSSFGVPVALKP